MVLTRVTSGVFFAPATGNQIFLRLMIDSRAPTETSAAFRINRIDAEGARTVFREAELPVPPGGGASIDIDSVAGRLEGESQIPYAVTQLQDDGSLEQLSAGTIGRVHLQG